MKNYLLLLFLVFGLFHEASAQEKFDFNKYKSPSSPAAYVLGVQPSAILSPKSFDAFEAAVFSNFMNSEGGAVIPNDFALEFSPYWAKDRGLTIEEYLSADILTQFKRNFSLSLASTQNFQLGDSTSTNAISFGFRTSLFLRQKDKASKLISDINVFRNVEQVISNVMSRMYQYSIMADNSTAMIDSTAGELRKQLRNSDNNYTEEQISSIVDSFKRSAVFEADFNENYDAFMDQLTNSLNSTLESSAIYEELKKSLFDQVEEKRGFYIDLAFASLVNFPVNTFGSGTSPRQSFWLTPTYRFKKNTKADFLRILGVLRYERYDQDYYRQYFPNATIYENNIDIGIALSAEFEQFSIQFEAIGRNSNSKTPEGFNSQGDPLYSEKTDSDFQALGKFNYKINDKLTFTYTLGNSFEQIINENNTLVSLFSLNFGFNKQDPTNIGIFD